MSEHTKQAQHSGRCHCGGVQYRIAGPMRDVVLCHCSQCRRIHGHYAAYTAINYNRLVLTVFKTLKWYQASEQARRGFCSECGASLFWQRFDSESICIAAGSLDQPTGLKTTRQVYVADAGDYYCIDDSLETFTGSMDE